MHLYLTAAFVLASFYTIERSFCPVVVQLGISACLLLASYPYFALAHRLIDHWHLLASPFSTPRNFSFVAMLLVLSRANYLRQQ
jgi:hypothetical protein